MSAFVQNLTILSADQSHSEAVDALVDTGSTYLCLPTSLVLRLGYRPITMRRLVTATGEQPERGLAPVLVRLNGETWPIPCIFGDEATRPLLGAMVLEAFGLGVDPVRQRLVPVPALAMSAPS
jgi:clan AA aspartic protease